MRKLIYWLLIISTLATPLILPEARTSIFRYGMKTYLFVKDQTYIILHPPLKKLIQKVAKRHGIDPAVLETIVYKESGPNADKVYRFEQKLYGKTSGNEAIPLASSHGITHILGSRALPDCGVHWSKLYDNEVALNCTAKIISDNLTRAKSITQDQGEQLRIAFRLYNGSGEAADRYSRDAMAKLGSILYEREAKKYVLEKKT